MTDFSAELQQINISAEKLTELKRRLNDLKSEVDGVKLRGIMNTAYSYRIEAALRGISGKILDEAVRMDSLGSALRYTVTQYRNAENAIMNTSAGDIGAGTKRGTDKRNWWGKFSDWLFRREPDEYETTTREQEKAADTAMKRELWSILQDERYSREHWDNASIEERKQILQDYMTAVIAVYGLQHVNPRIEWRNDLTYTENRITRGQYNHGRHRVRLNERALTDSVGNWDSYALLETVAHELRHAYQHEAVDHPTQYMVSQETIDEWADNFDHYIQPNQNRDGYRNQPVERDARDFQVTRDGSY